MPTVNDIYQQVLGRPAEPEGLAYWKSVFGDYVDDTELAQFKAAAAPELVQRGALPEDIMARVAASPDAAVKIGDTWYQGVYDQQSGSGETFDRGPLTSYISYTEAENRAGGQYTKYDTTGEKAGTGVQQKVDSNMLPFLLAAGDLALGLPGIGEAAGGGGLLGGGLLGAGGAGTTGQGNSGGSSSFNANQYPAAGGGGAGTVGLNAPTNAIAGSGGAGIASAISGSVVTYAGGGGGGCAAPVGTGGTGGVGGGGAGTSLVGAGTAGTVNTGGGGGATGGNTGAAGTGGSGIVILRYPDTFNAATSTTGSPTISTSGGFRVYKFTASGSITF